jgi:signal transduction histidine kinase
MKRWWIKPILVTLVLSFGLSALFTTGVGFYTAKKWHRFKLETLQRTAISLSAGGDYSGNLKRFGPIPEDGSSVFGRIWIIDASGKVLTSSTAMPIPPEAKRLALETDRSTEFPIEETVLPGATPGRFYFLPMPDRRLDTFIVQDLNRGPGKLWLRTVILWVLLYSLAVCLGVWSIIIWIFRRRASEVRSVVENLFQGKTEARVRIDRVDRALRLFEDINQMAAGIEFLLVELKRTDAARLELLRQLAHDIRTPLTSLRTATETLSSAGVKLSEEDFTQLTRIAHLETDYLGRLVEDLLYLAEQQITEDPVERVDVVEATRSLLLLRGSGKQDTNVYCFSSNCDAFYLFIQRVSWIRILTNLIDNAEKHGKAPIEVELERVGSGVRLRVRDHGPGMTESGLLKYGQRHGRAGTIGLGSVIVRNLVSATGGMLQVRCPEGGGFEVKIDWPNLPKSAFSLSASYDSDC